MAEHPTDDAAALIAKLRQHTTYANNIWTAMRLTQAADLLEAQAAELAALRQALDRAIAIAKSLAIPEMQTARELAQTKRSLAQLVAEDERAALAGGARDHE